jgi:CTP:molybdopterin cytidylyltransferase MocA
MESSSTSHQRPVAVLLAAGSGSRFHGDTHKLLANLRGRPLYEWALEHALAADHEVWLVTGSADLPVPEGVLRLPNPRWSLGQATSLRCAVIAASRRRLPAITVGLADQPFVSPHAWTAVSAASAPIAVATYAGRRAHPVRLGSAVWPLLTEVGDEGARSLMRERPDLVQEVPCGGSGEDIDTLEDLIRWNS